MVGDKAVGSNSLDRLPFSPGPSCPAGASVQQLHPGCPGLWGRGGGRGPSRPPEWRGPGSGQGSPEQDQGRQVIRSRVADGLGARRPDGHLRAGLQSARAQPDSRGRCLGRSRDKSRMGGCLGPLLNRGAPFPRCWLLILGAGPTLWPAGMRRETQPGGQESTCPGQAGVAVRRGDRGPGHSV